MRWQAGGDGGDCRFEAPPRFALFERRMAGIARDAWAASGGALVDGFPANSLVLADPGGAAIVHRVGPAVAATFGFAAGCALAGRAGLAEEIVAAADTAAFAGRPAPFEASVAASSGATCLVRGVALPVQRGEGTGCVQIVANWRELLGSAATAQLRRQIGSELHRQRVGKPIGDPFCPNRRG